MNDLFIDGNALEYRTGKKRSAIEMLLSLPQRSLSDRYFLELPETQVLLRFIYLMPWLLEVAEYKFEPYAANLIVARQYLNTKLEEIRLNSKGNK